MGSAIEEILSEDKRRAEAANAPFDPITGEASVGGRFRFHLPDFPIPTQMLPTAMKRERVVKTLGKYGSVRAYIENGLGVEYSDEAADMVADAFVRVRARHDFPFWAAFYVYIKPKGGGDDRRFILNRPQRRLVGWLEERRAAGKPIRLILLKARQWGGSTCIQLYMAWLQLVHKVGLNSLIVGNQKDAAIEVKDMFDRMIGAYPTAMLHRIGDAYGQNEVKMKGVGNSGNIFRIPQRNCKIKIGSAEKPDSARGGDYNLVHCTEVGVWRKTEGKTPEEIIDSATSGILLKPYTMIAYESTAKGVGNFFHTEYTAAKEGRSQFEPLFVPWYEIGQYSLPFADEGERRGLARWLYDNRRSANEPSDREESGKYYWWLWGKGATLENVNWYRQERRKYHDHGHMASEYPSDDVEAFVNSGANVFDRYQVEAFRAACRSPRNVGDVYADGDEGKAALRGLRFKEDKQGLLWVWAMPETDESMKIARRYLAVVDIGGRGKKADWSVIVVFDRLAMMDGGVPVVVAQWYGHIDMDLLAWKAAQVAAFYDDALLVIESNTLETKDRNHDVEGDQAEFILNQIKGVYPNLYARKQSEQDIIEKKPLKYGFHTNVATKPKVISTLVKVIRDGLYVERDARCLDEYLSYEKENGSYNAVVGKHDDLLMTRAIGLHVCFYEMTPPAIIDLKERANAKLHKEAISAATI